MLPLLYIFSDWSFLALRLILGIIFIAHGWPKLRNLSGTAEGFAAMGFKPGKLWGTPAALLEFFGGLALILGLFTQIAAALFVIQFLVINIWKLSQKQKLVGALEFDLLILAGVLTILTVGPGVFAADGFLRFLF